MVTIHQVEEEPAEGNWYQVQAWHKDDSAYRILFRDSRQWHSYGNGSTDFENVLSTYVDAKEIYAKVRILKTTKTVLTEDESWSDAR